MQKKFFGGVIIMNNIFEFPFIIIFARKASCEIKN